MSGFRIEKQHIDAINYMAGKEIIGESLIASELFVNENSDGSFDASLTKYSNECAGTLEMTISSSGEVNSQRGCSLWIDDFNGFANCTCLPIYNEDVINSIDANLIIGMLKSLQIEF